MSETETLSRISPDLEKNNADDPLRMLESIWETSRQIMNWYKTKKTDFEVRQHHLLGRNLIIQLERFDTSINWNNIDYPIEKLYEEMPSTKEAYSEKNDETKGEFYMRMFHQFKKDFDEILMESYGIVGYLIVDKNNKGKRKKAAWDIIRNGWFQKIKSFRDARWHLSLGYAEDAYDSFWNHIVLKNNPRKVAV